MLKNKTKNKNEITVTVSFRNASIVNDDCLERIMHWKEVLRPGKQAPYCGGWEGSDFLLLCFKRPDKRAYDPFPCHSESKQVT